MPPENTPIPTVKTRTWTLPTVLGLIISIVGALGVIALRPQIAVSPQDPVEKSNPFSVPFRIANVGYLPFRLERAFCYGHEIKVGGIVIRGETMHAPEWNRHTVDRNQSQTIICRLVQSPVMPATADIAIVVDYKPWQSFPRIFRAYYRFTGAYVDNWQWLAQPSAPIEKDADKEIEDHMRKIPSSR